MSEEKSGHVSAGEATPGAFYRTTRRIITVVERSPGWGAAPTDDAIPYLAEGNPESSDPRRQVTLRGWLKRDYMLAPCECPGWWPKPPAPAVTSVATPTPDAPRQRGLATEAAADGAVREWIRARPKDARLTESFVAYRKEDLGVCCQKRFAKLWWQERKR